MSEEKNTGPENKVQQVSVSGMGSAIAPAPVIVTKKPVKAKVPANGSSSEGSSAEAKSEVKTTKGPTRKKAATSRKAPAGKRAAAKTKKAGARRRAVSSEKAKAKEKAFSALGQKLTAPQQYKTMERTMIQGNAQMDKLTKEAQNFSRDNVEAFVKASNVWAKGCEDILREALSWSQDTAEKQSGYVKQAMNCKTVNEWTEVQSKIAQAGFDDFMAGVTRFSELSAKVFSEASEPLAAQAYKARK